MRGLNALGCLAGRTLLVEGAAGGVGSAAVEIAVAQGATVIGTASERNHEFLTSLGAVPTTYGPGLAQRLSLSLRTASTSRSTRGLRVPGRPRRDHGRSDARRDRRRPRRWAAPGHACGQRGERLHPAVRGGGTGPARPLHTSAPNRPTPGRITDAHAHAERGRTRGKIVIYI
ncbi:hypothetical protein LV779_34940 [Streptomyces thinghirensis]|nr:hypothetical protein [Streptomyces thinghirensis]